MKISELFALAIVMSIFYFLLQEGMYFFNFSSFTFLHTFRFLNSFFLRYMISFFLMVLFFFLSGILLQRFWKYFDKTIHYFLIAGILFIIENFSLKTRGLLEEQGILQSEFSLFFCIIFTSTLFFYSIHYVNLLEYSRNKKEKNK